MKRSRVFESADENELQVEDSDEDRHSDQEDSLLEPSPSSEGDPRVQFEDTVVGERLLKELDCICHILSRVGHGTWDSKLSMALGDSDRRKTSFRAIGIGFILMLSEKIAFVDFQTHVPVGIKLSATILSQERSRILGLLFDGKNPPQSIFGTVVGQLMKCFLVSFGFSFELSLLVNDLSISALWVEDDNTLEVEKEGVFNRNKNKIEKVNLSVNIVRRFSDFIKYFMLFENEFNQMHLDWTARIRSRANVVIDRLPEILNRLVQRVLKDGKSSIFNRSNIRVLLGDRYITSEDGVSYKFAGAPIFNNDDQREKIKTWGNIFALKRSRESSTNSPNRPAPDFSKWESVDGTGLIWPGSKPEFLFKSIYSATNHSQTSDSNRMTAFNLDSVEGSNLCKMFHELRYAVVLFMAQGNPLQRYKEYCAEHEIDLQANDKDAWIHPTLKSNVPFHQIHPMYSFRNSDNLRTSPVATPIKIF